MAISFDTSLPIRRPSARVELVEAVLAAHEADEAEWIEWKREVPLGTPAGNFKAACQILGFSNRKPVEANRFLGGQAYLLIGVEPGGLVGAPVVDPARLEDWLRPYLGDDGPVWDAHNVDAQDVHVVAIEVAPPRDGDPIRTLRKGYNEWHEGAVFIRRKGQTVRASSAEIAMLVARAAAASERVAVTVRWTEESGIPALDVAGDTLDGWVTGKRDALLRPLDADARRDRADSREAANADRVAGMAGSMMRELSRTASFMHAAGYQPDDRSREDFQSEVDSYLEELRKAAPVAAAARAMASGKSRLVAIVQNPTDTNFRRLRVRVHVPGPVIVVDAEDEEEWSEQGLPEAPRAWGSMRPPARFDLPRSMMAPRLFPTPEIPRIRQSGLHIEHEGSATVTADPIDLRPRDTVELDAIHLFPQPELAGQTIEATWEATSISADGVASGVLPIRVGDRPLTIEQLLEDPA
jgi:hypothetical protein